MFVCFTYANAWRRQQRYNKVGTASFLASAPTANQMPELKLDTSLIGLSRFLSGLLHPTSFAYGKIKTISKLVRLSC